MINSLEPYALYRDSKTPWLGEVPENWSIARLKARARNVVEQTDERSSGELYVALEHVESWTGRLQDPGPGVIFDSQVKKFLKGDVLFGKLRPYLAKVTRPEVNGVCVGEFLVLRPRTSGLHGAYLEKLLRSQPIIDAINSSTFGAKMPRADWKFVGGMKLCVPPPPEQAAIVRFLDHVDRRVRRYIHAKQKSIRLLEEQKQAFIRRVVTRGLDANVRLKPSGVDWLRDMPEHWDVRRNGRLFSQRNETGFADLPILEVSLRTGIRVRSFEGTDRKQVMSDRSKYKRAAKGDLAYNMMRMWQGAVGVAPAEGLVSPAYVVAKPLKGTEPRYFSSLFRTSVYMREVDKYSRGIVKDRNRLYWEDFKRMPSPYPPPDEQVLIADDIDRSARLVREAVAAARREVELIRELQTRLVADVVTGKLDVREAVARLPDEADEPEPPDESTEPIDNEDDTTSSPDAAAEAVEV